MTRLFLLPNGNLIDPSMIRGVKGVPKGVILVNEYNKILDLIEETDALRRKTILRALGAVKDAGREWIQVDWEVEFSPARSSYSPRASALDPA